MTRRESRKKKLAKQRMTMLDRGYKQIAGRWVREGSKLHKQLSSTAYIHKRKA